MNGIIKNSRSRYTILISKRIWLVTILSVIVFCVLIEPAYLYDAEVGGAIGIVHNGIRIMRYAVAGLVLGAFVIYRIKVNSLLVWTAVFELCLLLSTFINAADIVGWIRDGAYSIVLLLFMQMIFSLDSDLLLRSLSLVLGSYVHINTLTWVLYPKGLYVSPAGYWNCWFLGYDNVAAVIIFLAQIVALYRISSSENKWIQLWDWSILISGVVFIFRQMIGSAVVAEVAALLFLLATRNGKIRKTVGKAKLIVIGMLLLFLLIHFYIQQKWLFLFIIQFLGKVSTFTSRTRVWKQAWREIPQKPLLGRGIQQASEYIAMAGGNRHYAHLHSYYLQVIYEGGILAFGSFLVLLLCAAQKFDNTEVTPSDMILLAGFLGFLIMWQVEAYNGLIRYAFIMLFLIYNTGAIRQKKNTIIRGADL